MATVYVKKVDSSSRSAWVSGNSYVVGDRVHLESATLIYTDINGTDSPSIRTYVCLVDNSSTVSPEEDSINWVEAGTSKEYPYHSVGGNLMAGGEFYLEATNSRARTSGVNGTFYQHVRRDESFYSLGKAIIVSDEPNPVFYTNGFIYIQGFSIEPDPSIGKFSIVIIGGNANLGSWGSHNSTGTQYGKIDKCNIYGSGTAGILVGSIYNNTNYIEFTDCLFSEKASEVGFGDMTTTSAAVMGSRNFYGYTRCSFFFPNVSLGTFVYDTQEHSVGQQSFFHSCTFYFKSFNTRYLLQNTKAGFSFKNNIVYSLYTNQSVIDIQSLSTANIVSENNIFYINNDSPTINLFQGFHIINPQFLGSTTSADGLRLRPNSPLIGGIKSESALSDKYPEGLWVDHSHIPVQSSYSYTLDSGDGTNYTFSGDATGTDPTLNANIRDTLTFTNSTGGHPLAIYNSQGLEVASESSGTTTFTPKYPDTYYYQCTVSGHENMRGNIVVSMGTLGTISNPFSNYQHAIDAKAYTGSCDLLFKEGDHPMNGGGGPNGLTFESSYPNGIRFIGSSAKSTRLVTLDAINSWPMLYNSTSGNDTNGTISGSDFYFINIGIHLNNTTSYINRGILGVFRNLTLEGCIFSATATANINGSLISTTVEWFNAKGCIFNTPLGKTPGGDMWWFGGSYGITRYRIESCCFLNLSGYRRPTNENDSFFGITADSNSYFKNNIVYTDVPNCRYVLNSASGLNSGYWTTNWIGNSFYNTAVTIGNVPNTLSGDNVVQDPFFIDLTTENEDFRLRPDSPLIGGIKKDPTNVYYLQPGNTYNGDGSQKDASAMTADGDPGPFNNFQEIVAAGVPYGSTVIIVNGTYSWPNNFHTRKSASTWETLTYEGYNYKAETRDEVIFDGNKQGKFFGYQPYGGTAGSGTYLDLDTSFEGIQFNNVMGTVESTSRNQIFTASSSAGFGSCTFNSCKFLGWVNGGTVSYPWTGGTRNGYGSSMHWKGCTIVIAFDYAGSLLGGGDGFATDSYHGAWSWENCTFYIPVGLTTFNGRNALNGTYQSPSRLFGSNYNQSQRIFKNNILYIPGGNMSTGTTSVSNLPAMQNNCLVGVVPQAAYFDLVNDNNILDADPKFVDPSKNNFSLRPNSTMVGKGI